MCTGSSCSSGSGISDNSAASTFFTTSLAAADESTAMGRCTNAPTPAGSASLQLAFKVAAEDVDRCADELVRHGVDLLEAPTNQSFGHRTLFFRDPDGNLLEVYAEI